MAIEWIKPIKQIEKFGDVAVRLRTGGGVTKCAVIFRHGCFGNGERVKLGIDGNRLYFKFSPDPNSKKGYKLCSEASMKATEYRTLVSLDLRIIAWAEKYGGDYSIHYDTETQCHYIQGGN